MFGLSRKPVSASQAVWPALLLIFVAVLAPTTGLLWFMTQAVRSEQLAVRQRLSEVYHAQLLEAQRRLQAEWSARLAGLEPLPGETAGETFARLAAVADGVVVYGSDGRVAYPDEPAVVPVDEAPPAGWEEASRQELENPADAAAAYARIAASIPQSTPSEHRSLASQPAAPDPGVNWTARGLLAQARCLAKSGQIAAALGVLTGPFAHEDLKAARDIHGRLIWPNARLLALELVEGDARRSLAEPLIRQVSDYHDPALSAGQRLFLMRELQRLVPECTALPTAAAEELTAEYLGEDPPAGTNGVLAVSPNGRLWRLTSGSGAVVALFRKDAADAAMQALINEAVALPEVEVKLLPLAAQSGQSGAPFITASAGKYLPDYHLALFLKGADPFAAAARRRVLLYTWTGGAGVAVVAVLGLLLGRFVARQSRLTRLKNDLVATVSHELKTPLASMRVLIDTLSEGRCRDEAQVRDYYALIARENERLSRLIDNFLTFSRMERNKRAFELRLTDPAEVVTNAVAAMGERLAPPHCRLETALAPDLPRVIGDRDALVTVVLNLLDNAYKYSGSAAVSPGSAEAAQRERKITLRAYARDGQVCFEVQDNGIGLSRRAVRRVFDRFYQVDRSLSRAAGGCGLGLSIVKFIVDAHGGEVAVTSEPGRGSTFTVRLPAAEPAKEVERGAAAHV